MAVRPCRVRWLRRLALIGIFPIVVWALVVWLAPTEWARGRIERELTRAVGGPVHVGGLHFGFLGGIYLRKVELFEPDAGRGKAWLTADAVRVDLGLVELAIRGPAVRRVAIDGLRLRVGRREDGTCPLAALLGSTPEAVADEGAGSDLWSETERPPVAVEVTNGSVVVDDAPGPTRLELTELSARATLWSRVFHLERLEARSGGGVIRLALEVERGQVPSFELALGAEGVRLDGSVPPLSYLLPFVNELDADEGGLLSLELELKGQGDEPVEIRRSLVGHGRIRIDPVRLDRSALARELARVVPMPEGMRLGSLSSDFTIEQERITTPGLSFGVGRRKLMLGGSTFFDGRIDYRIESEGLTGDLTGDVGELIRRLPVDATGLLRVDVRGSIEDPSLFVNGQPLGEGSADDPLRELGRKVRERFLR